MGQMGTEHITDMSYDVLELPHVHWSWACILILKHVACIVLAPRSFDLYRFAKRAYAYQRMGI